MPPFPSGHAALRKAARKASSSAGETLSVVLVHALPGRFRFKIAGMRKNPAAARVLEFRLRAAAEFRSATANPWSATVLVYTAPGGSAAAVEDAIRRLWQESAGPGGPSWASESAALEESPVSWHSQRAQDVLRRLETRSAGLSRRSVRERLAFFGANRLPAMASRSLPSILRSQLACAPVALSIAAALASLFAGALAEGAVLLAIVALNTALGAHAENRAERILDTVRESVDLRARVIRGGRKREVSFEEVVPGDILDLEAGDRIPADGRLLSAEGLSVDEAAFTGESLPVGKQAAAPRPASLPLSLRDNMVFRGTLVVEGRGRAVVVATGADTALGRLQSFLGALLPPEALAVQDLRRLTRSLAAAGAAAAALFAVFARVRGMGAIAALRGVLGLLAAAIPAGLSTLSLSAFALGHRRLREKRLLVRRLRTLGSLAAVEVICFDKTGTLTLNRMVVSDLAAGGRSFAVNEEGFDPRSLREDGDADWELSLLTLCNEAYMLHEGEESLEGSSTERALILLAERAGIRSTAFRGEHPIVDIRHRSPERPFMVTRHRWSPERELVILKGSPVEVLERCTHLQQAGECRPMTAEDRTRIETENFRLAGAGRRVLGVAFRWDPPGDPDEFLSSPGGLVWSGLVGLADPLRPGARELIRMLHAAGIRTVVITGDQALTAQHIGRELQLAGEEPLRILDAADLRSISVERLRSLAGNAHVFARLNPAQKLQIVQAYQSAGRCVMMVGDGFNDVLALKVADVGIALGVEGAELARRTADLVLLDDDLLGVAAAIANGRSLYANLRRSLRYLAATAHLDVLGDFLARSGLGDGPPSWQSLGTQFACLALAREAPPERGIEGPPPPPSLLREGDLQRARRDAGLTAAAAGATALAGGVLGGGGESLFWASYGTLEISAALACREGDGAAERAPAGLRGLLALAAGLHAARAASSGGIFRFAGRALWLVAGLFLSRLLLQPSPEERASAPASHAPTGTSAGGSDAGAAWKATKAFRPSAPR